MGNRNPWKNKKKTKKNESNLMPIPGKTFCRRHLVQIRFLFAWLARNSSLLSNLGLVDHVSPSLALLLHSLALITKPVQVKMKNKNTKIAL